MVASASASPTQTAGSRAATSDLVGRAALIGAGFGVIASLVMAGYAMIASLTYQNTGFFTPLYHIASTFISPSTLMASMQHAATSSSFYFSFGPAMLGAAIHMMIGAMYGAVFGVAAVKLRLRGVAVVASGAAYGVMVFAISSWIGLPIASSIFTSGDQITHMAKMVGYGTFLVEHVLFGLTLGLLFAGRTRGSDNA